MLSVFLAMHGGRLKAKRMLDFCEERPMTYPGRIKNGVAVLDNAVRLPDGTPVRIAIEPSDSAFWRGKSIEELAREQQIQPVSDLDDLAGEWPDDESVDDFLVLIRRSRV